MQDAPPPDTMLCAFSNIKQTRTFTVDQATSPILQGLGGEYRLLMDPFCEYTMQGAPPLDPTLRTFSNIKQAYTATADQATSPISEGLGVNVAY